MLQLTAAGRARSVWRLPACFEPGGDRPPLTYHANPRRWSASDDGVLLRSTGRGQEFVLDCEHYPGVLVWLASLFAPGMPATASSAG
jgi:hypothetical protein